jgi:hypothetical protein
MGEQFRLGFDRLRKLLLQHLRNPLLILLPCALEHRLIGHLLGERVLEGVVELTHHPRFVEELGRLEVRQALLQRCLRPLGDGLEQRHRHLHTNDGSALQEVFVLAGQVVDTRRQHPVHRRRQLEGAQGGCGKVGVAMCPVSHPALLH